MVGMIRMLILLVCVSLAVFSSLFRTSLVELRKGDTSSFTIANNVKVSPTFANRNEESKRTARKGSDTTSFTLPNHHDRVTNKNTIHKESKSILDSSKPADSERKGTGAVDTQINAVSESKRINAPPTIANQQNSVSKEERIKAIGTNPASSENKRAQIPPTSGNQKATGSESKRTNHVPTLTNQKNAGSKNKRDEATTTPTPKDSASQKNYNPVSESKKKKVSHTVDNQVNDAKNKNVTRSSTTEAANTAKNAVSKESKGKKIPSTSANLNNDFAEATKSKKVLPNFAKAKNAVGKDSKGTKISSAPATHNNDFTGVTKRIKVSPTFTNPNNDVGKDRKGAKIPSVPANHNNDFTGVTRNIKVSPSFANPSNAIGQDSKGKKIPPVPENRNNEATRSSKVSPTFANPNSAVKEKSKIIVTPSMEQPIFVLSLPGSGNLALHRYFQCTNSTLRVGRHWATEDGKAGRCLGECLRKNIWKGNKNNPLESCSDYDAYMELDYVAWPKPAKQWNATRQCFFPSLRPKVLKILFEKYPNAKVVNVVQDPHEWYQTLAPSIKDRWFQWCNTPTQTKHVLFPSSNATEEAWVSFYNQHQQLLQKTISKHPSVKYLEVNLTSPSTASLLQETLGLSNSNQCWSNPISSSLPTDITLPVFVASLPKSATSTCWRYLDCGLGNYSGNHQWTRDSTTNERLLVGDCWRDNLRAGRPLLQGCGDQVHWSDWGALREGEECFYATMHGGMEAFAKDHPYGTILHALRDASGWYQSARKHGNFTLLSRFQEYRCPGFPDADPTDQEAWMEFYDWHTHHVRQFARSHPTMRYVEIQIEDQEATLQTLRDNFGFPDSCWGHANKNKNDKI